MQGKEFDYSYIEVICSDLKMIFITDEKATVTCHSDVHMHSFWELFHLKKGSLIVNSESNLIRLDADQMLIIPPNTYHSSAFSENAIKESVFFTFERVKKPEDDEKLYDTVLGVFSGCGFCKIEDYKYLSLLLAAALENDATCEFAKGWRMRANAIELIFSLCDKVQAIAQTGFDNTLPPSTYWVYKYAIDRLLDTYYSNDISLEFLSKKLFVSPQNITRIISSAYGKSFNELKLELKMRNAKKMLRETELSVSEIGEKIGYTTSRGFLSAFTKYEGCTPSEYRKRHCPPTEMS